jgi:hypothetical protein
LFHQLIIIGVAMVSTKNSGKPRFVPLCRFAQKSCHERVGEVTFWLAKPLVLSSETIAITPYSQSYLAFTNRSFAWADGITIAAIQGAEVIFRKICKGEIHWENENWHLEAACALDRMSQSLTFIR